MADQIAVLIVDDHPVVRQGIRVLLEVHDGLDVAGEAADGEQALAMAAERPPDVILLDLKLPGMDGIEVLGELRARGITSRVLVLTSGNDPGLVTRALRSGAAGFLYKDVDPDALVRAVRAVHDGNLLLAPAAAGPLVGPGGGGPPGAARPGPADRHGGQRARSWGGVGALTSREREVLGQIARGLSNREIARALHVSEKTVKTHVSAVLAKLGVQDRTQAALYAVRHASDG
ncbi:MAG TPA: response regulator transcription factor [Trebonia sp.]|nr:response regulator transcription factor [Trebonia sp.]